MTVSPGQVADAVFFGDSATGTWSELATDDSGEDTDLTAGASWAYETSSARANLTESRTVDLHIDHNALLPADTLWYWDRAATFDQIEISGNIITLYVNGASIGSHTISAIDTTSEEFIISWAMEPNPDTTGASDARRSELHIYNLDDTAYEQSVFTHALPTAGTGTVIFGASSTGGADTYTGDVYAIRLSSGFHSSDEQYETFVSQSAAPTLSAVEFKPLAIPDRLQVAIGDDSYFAGPPQMFVGRSTELHRMLLAGPVVNDANNDGELLDAATEGGKTVGLSYNGTVLRIEHLYWRPMPLGATHVVPYLHVQSDEGASSADLVVTVYSMNYPGNLSSPQHSSGQFEPYFASETITTDHGAGANVGEWVTMSPVRIAHDRIGFSYFCVALDIDTAASSNARVNTVCLDPVFIESGDGLGQGGVTFG